MREKLRRFDKGVARGEAAITTVVLLVLVVVAAAQSLFRNIADTGALWANDVLQELDWADSFMEKATLWLAMFGASLATHYHKHIAIDVLARVAKPKVRAVMRGIASVFAGVTSFYFARVVLGALLAKSVRIPGEYAVLGDDFGTTHICEGSLASLERADMVRPDLFCGVRSVFDSVGLTINTPERAMDLLVPAMFCIIGARLFAIGVGAFMTIPEGGIRDEELGGTEKHAVTDEQAESAKAAAVHDVEDAVEAARAEGEATEADEEETP